MLFIIGRVGPQNNYVPETVDGLKQVAKGGDWRSVVDMSGKLVADADFDATGTDSLTASLQLRFEGLFRMKLFDDLSLEISKVLGAELKYMESKTDHNEPPKQGVYKIVSLTVLLSEIKSLTGRGGEALEQLYKLRTNLKSMIDAADSRVETTSVVVYWWQVKIWNQIINILLRQRQWHLALHELSQLLLEVRQLRDKDQCAEQSSKEG